MKLKNIRVIKNGIFVAQTKNGKYCLLKEGKIQSIEVPTTTALGGPTAKVTFFDRFRNEEKNEYYFEVWLKETGWISIYKEGPYLLEYEPQPDLHHPYIFHTIPQEEE